MFRDADRKGGGTYIIKWNYNREEGPAEHRVSEKILMNRQQKIFPKLPQKEGGD